MPIRKATNLRLLLMPLPWRLPNGIKGASDNELETSGDACEELGWWCGGIVALAVLGEAAIAYFNPAYGSFWEHWGSVVANAAVWVGVSGEVQFSRMAFRRDKELKRRSDEKMVEANKAAAQATQDAAEARLESEKTRATFSWRAVGERGDLLLTELSAVVPGDLHISVVISDPDSQSYANQIAIVFRFAGWRVTTAGVNCTTLRFGLVVRPPYELNLTTTLNVVKAIHGAGLSVSVDDFPGIYHSVGMGGDKLATKDPAYLFVGPKEQPIALNLKLNPEPSAQC